MGSDIDPQMGDKNQQRHSTPKGLTQKPQNRIERHKAEMKEEQEKKSHQKPDDEPLTETANDKRKVGVPVGTEGTISSIPPDVIDDNDAARDVIDTVVEGRLGGGEKVVYSSKDGPPLQPQDPTPRS